MYRPSLKATLAFVALWLGFFLLLQHPGHAGPSSPAPLMALLLAVTIFGLYGALHFGRRAWRLADTPIARIRSAPQGYVELHDVTGLLPIEPDEVMFIAKRDDRFSSLVVGASGTCSQFANIRPSILRADLNDLDPAALMAALQLSLAENIIETL